MPQQNIKDIHLERQFDCPPSVREYENTENEIETRSIWQVCTLFASKNWPLTSHFVPV